MAFEIRVWFQTFYLIFAPLFPYSNELKKSILTPGMSPGAHTGDGSTDLIIVRKTHHVNYLRYLIRSVMLVVLPLIMKHLIVVNYR